MHWADPVRASLNEHDNSASDDDELSSASTRKYPLQVGHSVQTSDPHHEPIEEREKEEEQTDILVEVGSKETGAYTRGIGGACLTDNVDKVLV